MCVGLVLLTLLIALMQGVFCQSWAVMLPQSIMVVNGSCVTVPCQFTVPRSEEAKLQNCSDGAVWKRGSYYNRPILSASSMSSNGFKGQIDGDLTRKNCTTTFHGFTEHYNDIYFFRLDCPNEMKYSFPKAVSITVEPGRPAPRLTPVGEASEGDQVRLLCWAPVPCPLLPPSLTWLPRDATIRENTLMQQGEDGQVTLMSTLTLVVSARHHNQSVTCGVSYPLPGGGSSRSAATLTLRVLYAPRFTVATLSTSGPVPEGSIVMFTCSSDANPPVSLYTWYRFDSGQLTKIGEGETLSRQVSRTDGGLYLCEAQSQRGSHKSRSVFLDVSTSAAPSGFPGADGISYLLCGAVLILSIFSVAVAVYKYQRLSRRLKQLELKGEHTYADLRISTVTADYDQIQLQQPKTMPTPELPNYENLQKSLSSVINHGGGHEGTR